MVTPFTGEGAKPREVSAPGALDAGSFGAVPALECCVTLDEPLPALNPIFASPKAQK